MKSRYQRPRPNATINITPYIDILLVLLIIFMVIQPTKQYQMPARALEKAPKVAERAAVPPNLIVVAIDEEFQISINSQPVAFPDLGRRLFDILNARADRTIYIKGPAELPFGDVVRIIDIAKGAGAGNIGLL